MILSYSEPCLLLPGLLLAYMSEFVWSPTSLWIGLAFVCFLTEFFLLNYMDVVLTEIMSMTPSLILFLKLQHDCLL